MLIRNSVRLMGNFRSLRRVLRCSLVLTVLGATAVSRAAEPPSRPPLRWDPAFSHAGAWDYALTGVGLTTLALETVLLQSKPEPARWTGPILFDEPMRNLFHASTQAGRDEAANVSWVLWSVELGYPLVVDVPYAWIRFGRDVAWDLFWQDATALSLSSVADFTLRDTVARLRPGSYECLRQGGTNCVDSPEATRSFPSGHVSEATTAAVLLCTQHLVLHLYGPPWDALTCTAATATDVAIGALRLVTDNHYMTDVLAGGALGLAFGWGVPVVMHLHRGADPQKSGRSAPPMIVPGGWAWPGSAGLSVTGFF